MRIPSPEIGDPRICSLHHVCHESLLVAWKDGPAQIHLRETQLNRFWNIIHHAHWQSSHIATHEHSINSFRIHISRNQISYRSPACVFSTANIICSGSVLLNRWNVLFLNMPFLHTQDLHSHQLSQMCWNISVFMNTSYCRNGEWYHILIVITKNNLKNFSLSFMELSSMLWHRK